MGKEVGGGGWRGGGWGMEKMSQSKEIRKIDGKKKR